MILVRKNLEVRSNLVEILLTKHLFPKQIIDSMQPTTPKNLSLEIKWLFLLHKI